MFCLAACSYKPAEKPNEPVVVDVLTARPVETDPLPPDFGTWEYATGIPLRFSVSGTLEQGTTPLKAGDRFPTGQLLFQVNNREAYRNYSRLKQQLIVRFREFLPDVRRSFPDESGKWENFIAALEKPELLPPFPAFASDREAALFDYLKPDYLSLVQLETKMPDYFALAPFDGIVLETAVPVGATIRPGQTVAYIGRNREMIARITVSAGTIPDSVVNLYGNFKEISVAARLQSVRQQADGTQWLQYKPLGKVSAKKGQEIRIKPLHQSASERFIVPKSAVRDNRVCVVLPDGKTALTTVRVQAVRGDSLVIAGLQAGEHVLATYRTSLPAKRTLRLVR